jgi:hypothetical protein
LNAKLTGPDMQFLRYFTHRLFEFPIATRFVVCLIAVLFTACSATRLTYNYLDWIIPRYVNDYVKLNSEQKHLLQTLVNKKLKWHRSTQLPQYIQFLDTVRLDLEKPVTYGQISAYYATYNKLWNEVIIEFIPDIALLLRTTSDIQIDQLQDSFRTQNKNLRQQYLFPEHREVVRFRARSTGNQLKNWIKYLTPVQKQYILSWSESLLPVNQQWMYYRLLWQQNFKFALRYRRHNQGFDRLIQQLFLHPKSYWSSTYETAVHKNEKYTIDLYVNLISSLKPDQKNYFLHKIDILRRDLQQLTRGT